MDSEVQEKVAESQAAVKDFLEKAGDEVSAKTYSYKCEVSTGAAGGGFLNVNFIKNGKTFAQFKGGFVGGVGAYTGWGRAWFSKPVEQLIGESGAFALELVGVLGGTAHVQITGKGFVGDCSTGGIGVGGGVAAGGGKFS